MRIGRPSHATIVAYLALALAMSGTAVAATGGTFVLGRSNSATSTTSLSNSAGTPLSLSAKSGYSPLRVNSSVKVPYLNSDRLDGLDSTQFQRPVAGSCTYGIKSLNQAGWGTCASGNATTLDGYDSSQLQKATSADCQFGIASITPSGASQCASGAVPQAVVVNAPIGNLGGTATCPNGYTVTGGGFQLPYTTPDRADHLRESRPTSGGVLGTIGDGFEDGWWVSLDPVAANSFQVNAGSTVYAVCIKVST
jgi:hypothetical protein